MKSTAARRRRRRGRAMPKVIYLSVCLSVVWFLLDLKKYLWWLSKNFLFLFVWYHMLWVFECPFSFFDLLFLLGDFQGWDILIYPWRSGACWSRQYSSIICSYCYFCFCSVAVPYIVQSRRDNLTARYQFCRQFQHFSLPASDIRRKELIQFNQPIIHINQPSQCGYAIPQP